MIRNKGITLIALVITIIVLLILAAVSIATLTGENGILTQANKAKNKTEQAHEKEQIQLAYMSVKSRKMETGDNTKITAEDLNDEFNNDGIEAKATEEDGKIKVTFSKTGNEYEINENGEITGPNIGATIKVISGTEGENSWYTSDVEISIKNNGGTKNRVTYELTGETQQTEKEITNEEVIRISNEGITEIIARSYDENNDIQTSRMQIKKDSIAPTIEKPEDIIVDINTNVDENFIKEKNTIKDNLTEVRISDIKAKTSSGTGTEISLTGYDIYTISYNIKDEAGNTTEVEQNVTTKPTEAINLTNIVSDPSFESGSMDGWYNMGNSSCSITTDKAMNGVYSFKVVGTDQVFPRKNYGDLSIANKNIYVSSFVTGDDIDSRAALYGCSVSTPDLWQDGRIDISSGMAISNEWKKISVMLTTENTKYNCFALMLAQTAMGRSNYTIWWDAVVGIDLTPFGEKVPTKNWLDKMITYFEGTKTFNW